MAVPSAQPSAEPLGAQAAVTARPHVGNAGFEAFYRAQHRDLTAMLYALTGDWSVAQDLAQETFCRAWQHWAKVIEYDNPVAWIRRVATNLATNRWRRLRVAAAFLRRQHADVVPELSPDRVALAAALQTLPAHQRRAVVLHHVMDLPVAEVAEILGTRPGTVKSWLHRGRATLATRLGVGGRG